MRYLLMSKIMRAARFMPCDVEREIVLAFAKSICSIPLDELGDCLDRFIDDHMDVACISYISEDLKTTYENGQKWL